ncbi:MAG: septum formation initiator family protein [Candidatus Omnitrophica bacterium]|nr:septum formation initiator family protein [Candidatus Omnitrophota bacterium]
MAKIKIRQLYIVIIVALIVVFLPGYAKFMELRAKNIYLEKEIERLEQENVNLYKEKEKLKEDIDYIEKVARESMGVTREGEIPIKIEP